MADATLIAAIRKAASQTGADPALMVATSLVESGATWYPSPGDNGTSFGPFQFHIGGALGSNPPAWASTYAAIVNRAQAFVGAATGTDAARIQGPTNQAVYAAKVNAELPAARQLLAQVPASTPTTPTATGGAPSPGAAVATIAQTQIGVPYSFGGGTLAGASLGSGQGAGTVGFDCSGLVLWAMGQIGISLPHQSGQQYALGIPVAQSDLQPGDVVFFDPGSDGTPDHEGLYIGSGKFIEAPHTGTKVSVQTLAGYGTYVGARRYVAPSPTARNGALVPAASGRLVTADSTSLLSNWKAAVANLSRPSGLPSSSSVGSLISSTIPTVPSLDPSHYANEAVQAALGPVGDAITAATSSLESAAGAGIATAESKVAHAAVWMMLASSAIALIYLGVMRAVAPGSTPIRTAVKTAASAAGKVE